MEIITIINNNSNAFDNNDISMKINRQSEVEFRSQDLRPDCCIKCTLRASNFSYPTTEIQVN